VKYFLNYIPFTESSVGEGIKMMTKKGGACGAPFAME
jgi:hypothetical protein